MNWTPVVFCETGVISNFTVIGWKKVLKNYENFEWLKIKKIFNNLLVSWKYFYFLKYSIERLVAVVS